MAFFTNLKDVNTANTISKSYSRPVAASAVSVGVHCLEFLLFFSLATVFNFGNFISDEFIIGRVIKAMNANWHPKCFLCELCRKELADMGFVRNQGRALCHDCNNKEKAVGSGKYVCYKCQ